MGAMLKRLLVPLDGSAYAECVFPHVVALARAFGSEVVFLHVMDRAQSGDPTHAVDPLQWYVDKIEATLYLKSVVARLRKLDISMQTIILEGRAHECIVESGRDFDLTILSSHGKNGPSEWSVGSVTQKVLSRSVGSVLLVRAHQPTASDLTEFRYQRLLVPLDGSWRAESVLPLASVLAQSCTAQLQIAHVVSQPEMPRRLPPTKDELDLRQRVTESNYKAAASYLEQLRSRLPAESRIHLISGESVVNSLQSLVEQERTDLVALSAHGYSGDSRRAYGGVAANLITYGTTPLLVMQDMSALRSSVVVQAPRPREVPRNAFV
jgi:nucleotide-binding universal stress UspA family protein